MKKIKIFGKSLNYKDLKAQDLAFSKEVYSFLQDYFHSDYLKVQTSGSTRKPRSIILRKENMRSSAQATIKALNLEPGNKTLLCLPTRRIAGKMMLIRWLEGDLDLYYSKPSAKPLDEIEGRFDFAAMVPYQVEASLKDLYRVKKLVIGGGPIDQKLQKELQELSGEVYHTYGMTETISHVALRRVNGNQKEEFFRSLSGVRFSTDEIGRLIIDAPAIGVKQLISNDIVELKDKQSFVWKGRHDNVINSGGIKLQPEEIELKIKNIQKPYFVFGLPNEKWGEKLVLIVESKEYEQPDFSDLHPYEKPKAIFYLPEFVRTENGKIKRKKTALLLD